MSDEAKMTGEAMSQNIIDAMEEAFENFVPRPRYEIVPVQERPSRLIKHKLYNY